MLVTVWAVVLVPMWAHRQHTPAESDLSPGTRVIARRPQPPAVPGEHSARSGSVRVGPVPPARVTMLRRRRTALSVLSGVLLLALLAVLIGFPAPLLLVAALPYAGYLLWLRSTAAQAAARRAVLRRRVAGQRAASFRDFGAPPASGPVEPVAASASPALPLDAVATAEAAASASAEAGSSSTPWLPVPLPLPSYVTAAPAPRVIDGDWHEEELLDGELPGEASAYALGADILRRRAVGD